MQVRKLHSNRTFRKAFKYLRSCVSFESKIPRSVIVRPSSGVEYSRVRRMHRSVGGQPSPSRIYQSFGHLVPAASNGRNTEKEAVEKLEIQSGGGV